MGERGHRITKFFCTDGQRQRLFLQAQHFIQTLFLGLDQQAFIHRAVIGLLILFFLNRDNIGGAFIGGQQIGAVISAKQRGQRIDAGQQPHQIVFAP